MKLIETEEGDQQVARTILSDQEARHLARMIVSDVVLYNHAERIETIANLGDDLQAARVLFRSRVVSHLRPLFEEVLDATGLAGDWWPSPGAERPTEVGAAPPVEGLAPDRVAALVGGVGPSPAESAAAHEQARSVHAVLASTKAITASAPDVKRVPAAKQTSPVADTTSATTSPAKPAAAREARPAMIAARKPVAPAGARISLASPSPVAETKRGASAGAKHPPVARTSAAPPLARREPIDPASPARSAGARLAPPAPAKVQPPDDSASAVASAVPGEAVAVARSPGSDAPEALHAPMHPAATEPQESFPGSQREPKAADHALAKTKAPTTPDESPALPRLAPPPETPATEPASDVASPPALADGAVGEIKPVAESKPDLDPPTEAATVTAPPPAASEADAPRALAPAALASAAPAPFAARPMSASRVRAIVAVTAGMLVALAGAAAYFLHLAR